MAILAEITDKNGKKRGKRVTYGVYTEAKKLDQ